MVYHWLSWYFMINFGASAPTSLRRDGMEWCHRHVPSRFGMIWSGFAGQVTAGHCNIWGKQHILACNCLKSTQVVLSYPLKDILTLVIDSHSMVLNGWKMKHIGEIHQSSIFLKSLQMGFLNSKKHPQHAGFNHRNFHNMIKKSNIHIVIQP